MITHLGAGEFAALEQSYSKQGPQIITSNVASLELVRNTHHPPPPSPHILSNLWEWGPEIGVLSSSLEGPTAC